MSIIGIRLSQVRNGVLIFFFNSVSYHLTCKCYSLAIFWYVGLFDSEREVLAQWQHRYIPRKLFKLKSFTYLMSIHGYLCTEDTKCWSCISLQITLSSKDHFDFFHCLSIEVANCIYCDVTLVCWIFALNLLWIYISIWSLGLHYETVKAGGSRSVQEEWRHPETVRS